MLVYFQNLSCYPEEKNTFIEKRYKTFKIRICRFDDFSRNNEFLMRKISGNIECHYPTCTSSSTTNASRELLLSPSISEGSVQGSGKETLKNVRKETQQLSYKTAINLTARKTPTSTLIFAYTEPEYWAALCSLFQVKCE